MNSATQKVLEAALQLPEPERAEVAARLLDSLDRQAEEDAQAAWEAEIGRRIAELDSGAVRAIPWEEARRIIVDGPNAPAGT